ncbi:hypothetical protein ILUMI_14622, partial [Ignelater luminosus]
KFADCAPDHEMRGWGSCGPEPTCANYLRYLRNPPELKICTSFLVQGCYCKMGLYKNKEGICVPKEKCTCERPD